MAKEIIQLNYADLAVAIIPALLVIGILFRWTQSAPRAIYAMTRMLIQLLLIGYFLVFIFAADQAWIILSVLLVMSLASTWIALGVAKDKFKRWFFKAFVSIVVGSGGTLFLISQFVLDLTPWFDPQYLIPIAGMIFAGSMNSISLAAERLLAELSRDIPYCQARAIAFNAALIPIINALFAVGLVSLPGMMTGQILSGISPLIAARYQIMVMCMIFGSTGIASACFLTLVRTDLDTDKAS